MVHPHQHLERVRINFSWILKLRWAAAAGQLATILLVRVWFGIELPLTGLFTILAFEALSNIVLGGWFNGAVRAQTGAGTIARIEMVLGSIMAVDILLLTLLLFLTGGPTNPFAVFYMVNIVLSAVVLSPSWTAAISVLALGCFGTLFFVHLPLPELEAMNDRPAPDGVETWFAGRLSLYLRGLLVAFGTAASVIALFVTRLTAELRAREVQLTESHRQQARSEHLEALGTLAAGAAHELASPLSTIAVVARDLEVALSGGAPDRDAADDARLIRQEVGRCRAILDQMAADAGHSAGEADSATCIDELLDLALQSLKGRDHVELRIDPQARPTLVVPRRALSLALRQIIKNALDAAEGRGPVRIEVTRSDEELCVSIADGGAGMSAETVARATDPFFTTKEPGKGMGLGLFLSRTVVERLRGRIAFDSRPGQGTTVRVELPWTSVRRQNGSSGGDS